MIAPGPAEFGRGVVVRAGQQPPDPWMTAERIRVGAEQLADPAAVVARLHRRWLERRRVVVELDVEPAALRAPERCGDPPYQLAPSFTFERERLAFLVWANTYDARNGEPVWWHARKAARSLAEAGVRLSDGPADVTLPDGRPAWIDGGPPPPPVPSAGPVSPAGPPVPSAELVPPSTSVPSPVLHRWSVEAGRLVETRSLPVGAELAADQLAAVSHPSGPARVIAPAGSGKTRVLTERLRHLLADRAVPPETVTAVAFNRQAAGELLARTATLRGGGGPHVRTINGLALALVNRYGPGPVQVIDELDARRRIEDVFAVRHQANTDVVAPYLQALTAVRLGLRSPAEVEEDVPDAAGLAEGFERYRASLLDAGVVDFDEQIYRAIEILLTDPDARADAQRSCRHLLVDEFQDLQPAHLLLLRLLASPGFDVFGVGDDDQVIYGYAGADPEFLIHFDRYVPGAAAYDLGVNYRCPAPVVDAASNLLAYNHRRLPKHIRAASGDPTASGALRVQRVRSEQLAAAAVAAVEAWRDGGAPLDTVAVLARINAALLPVQVMLTEAGVASNAPLDATVLRRTGLRSALAYLRIGLDPSRIDRADLSDTIRRPSRRLSRPIVEQLTRPPRTSLARIEQLAARLTGGDAAKLIGYVEDVRAVSHAAGCSTRAAFRTIRCRVGLGEAVEALDSSRGEADRASHRDDLLALEAAAALHPEAATFETWLRDTLAAPQPSGSAVLLSSVHRIKGREWDHVIVFGATQDLFPHQLSPDVEEERRVFHVALTRARLDCLVLGDAEAPSEFLDELTGTRPRTVPAARPSGVQDARSRPSAGTAGTAQGGRRRRTVPAATAPTGGLETAGPEVRAVGDALRAWRREVASRDGVPAYIVLTNDQLDGIAARRPASLRELARCPGMGAIRLERYGDELLAVIEKASSPG